ncbi:hypothetical protein Afil01_18290 [Actinorhabdospora filicis]|uniref:Uncharacterized protein n=1 Tax=Actinorhabdospora filicis TaxID=1785913 RepID=A0A9W6SJD2_9ACTN|nr:hypothetical protein [Actinorhabdospora filicis]GLZ77022.1 hypothetical protein Afil01_18290 [Actinorhabdospora filicis]
MPSQFEITLNGFVDFLRTRGAARVDVVTRQLTQYTEPYSPARDFYRRILNAIVSGRRTGTDEETLRAVLEAAPQYKKAHYQQVVDGWLAVLPQFTGTRCLRVHTGRWHNPSVTVRATPHLLLARPDGRKEALWLYLKADPLPAGDAEAMLYLAGAAMPEIFAGAEPVVVDVRRQKIWCRGEETEGFGVWLESEANGYKFLAEKWEDARA